jgi:hypothetical protein
MASTVSYLAWQPSIRSASTSVFYFNMCKRNKRFPIYRCCAICEYLNRLFLSKASFSQIQVNLMDNISQDLHISICLSLVDIYAYLTDARKIGRSVTSVDLSACTEKSLLLVILFTIRYYNSRPRFFSKLHNLKV